jgi:hypothetical protein
MAQCEAPETTTPVPDEELTPLDGWRLLEELEVVDDVEDVDVDAAVDDVDEDLPGIVSALITVNTPRPANAPTAVQAVRRFSPWSAASRARTLPSMFDGSMPDSLGRGTEPDLGIG